MNATIPGLEDAYPVLRQMALELPIGVAGFIVPLTLFYLSIYAHIKGFYQTFNILLFTSIAAFFASHYMTPMRCGPIQCLQNFMIAIATMKALDIFARRNNVPRYACTPKPRDSVLALIAFTELRYESFDPNRVRASMNAENFSETNQLALHTAAFAVLQAMPQEIPTILAWEVLLAIYILWTTMQLVLRYKTSPALFGPLYLADSLTGFWSETWHNAFASPCTSLAYGPVRRHLPRLGVPVPIARSLGVIAAFGLMAVFHTYALTPILPRESLLRIAAFFLINGVATVVEAFLWGWRKHWVRALLAWTFETALATWTAEAARIPHGLRNIPWKDMCDAPTS